VRNALRNVAKKGTKGSAIGLDLGLIGVETEDLQPDKEERGKASSIVINESLRIDYSTIDEAVPDIPRVSASSSHNHMMYISEQTTKLSEKIQKIDLRTFNLTRDGRLLRFTSFFSGQPAHSKGRYRARKLRIKKKRNLARPIVLLDDQTDIFRKTAPTGRLVKQTLYQQILTSLSGQGKRRISPRFRQLEEAFEARTSKHKAFISNPEALQKVPSDERLFHPIEVIDWEDNIVMDSSANTTSKASTSSLYAGAILTNTSGGPTSRISSNSTSRPTTPISMLAQRPSGMSLPTRPGTPSANIAPKSMAGRIINVEFASGRWEGQIIWDDTKLPEDLPPINVQLNLNDPHLIFEAVDVSSLSEKILKTEKLIQKRLKKLRHGTTSDGKSLVLAKFDRPVTDRFNLSNDKYYESAPKENNNSLQGRTGATSRVMVSSRVGVQHSVPAMKLSSPYFKTFWTKNDLRSWHRPKLETDVLVNRQISFEKLVKKRDGAGRKSAAGVINNSKKISLRETPLEYALLEYSEEHPLLMANVGMASFILNFHRKQQQKDTPVLECDFGVPRVLEPNEASPFWIFGDVRPGETITAIQNNLFRAPTFEHAAVNTDFLVLKYNLKGRTESKWFIRELPSKLLTVGQVFPTMEVFGPHSRKHNIFCRCRIQAFAYRLFRKDIQSSLTDGPENLPRLKISRIMAAFPQFSEGSLRKWLKEYADSIRTGHDSGTWRMRRDAPNLNEDDIRALVTPEMVCQYESMLAGQQRLNDAGFMDLPEVEGGDEDEVIDNESYEVRLAPWNLSSNFINATIGKCTLQLHGLGDPSGRGESFSFVKVPQKTSVGAKLSIAPEPQIQNQAAAPHSSTLGGPSQPRPVKMSPEQAVYRQEIVKIWDAQLHALRSTAPVEEETSSNADGQFSIFDEISGGKDDDSVSVTSRSSMNKANRKLIIRRVIRDPDTGVEREETETIDDPRLLTAYINQRRVWERKRRRREIAAAASAARAKKARPEGVIPKQPKSRPVTSKSRKEVNIRCGTCGQTGHMRTNRICPRYQEYEAELKRAEEDAERRRLARESTGVRVEGTTISFNRALLDSVASAPVPPIHHHHHHSAEAARPTSPLLQYIAKPRKKKGLDLESLSPERRTALEALTEHFMRTIEALMVAPESWPFHKAVSKTEYPHYFRIISRPIDLGTIKSRVKRHYYTRVSNFLTEIQLVRDNCIQFNLADHVFSVTASKLYDMAVEQLSDPKILELEKIFHSETEAAITNDDVEHAEVVIDDQ
jgi:transcription initiation factor TFIID subunit 1